MQIPDLFWHNTNIQTFFMHVEDSDMNGWIASSKPFDNINIGQQLLIFNRDLRREDVEAAYTENVTAYSVQFPKTRESATDPIWVDGQNIGTLFKYYVSSKFLHWLRVF